jgi:hypothetical protein
MEPTCRKNGYLVGTAQSVAYIFAMGDDDVHKVGWLGNEGRDANSRKLHPRGRPLISSGSKVSPKPIIARASFSKFALLSGKNQSRDHNAALMTSGQMWL